MSDSDVLIRCENVGKKFCRDLKKSLWYGVKDSAADIFSRNSSFAPCGSANELRPGEFWANKDISFALKRGECLGLIGHNGAGKTTLLKMLNGLIKPDCGRIMMSGHTAALIALGAGFNPVLTGRENVLVNGSILGLSRRCIRKKLDEIVEFADIENAIDAPVRTYSSGMQVRLGFASAAILMEPDVLIVDEILAVGDVAFQAKCVNKISRLVRNSAVILVSHQMGWIHRLSSVGMLLAQGKIHYKGNTESAVKEYLATSSVEIRLSPPSIHSPTIKSISLSPDKREINTGDELNINYSITGTEKVRAYFSITLLTPTGECLAQYFGKSRGEYINISSVMSRCTVRLGRIPLVSGTYIIAANLIGPRGESLASSNSFASLKVNGSLSSSASVELGAKKS